MLKRILHLLAGIALLLPTGCASIGPAPSRLIISRSAYLPSPLPRRPKQHVLDSLADASRSRATQRQ